MHFRVFAAAVTIAGIAAAALAFRHELNLTQKRQSRALYESSSPAHRAVGATAEIRRRLFAALQPIPLENCELRRFGEPHDGGYLMCANLLSGAEVGYSYGISGYDGWGCDISTRLDVTVHQYDCFDTRAPACPDGKMQFHPECVADTTKVVEGRPFDTLQKQFARNGDGARPVVLKMDVEGAEWDSLVTAPEELLKRIDQMAVEFHRVEDEKFVHVIERLKQFFFIAHLHFNNYSCLDGLDPFPAWAYEVLFVSKRLGVPAPSTRAVGLHPEDAPNNPWFTDCQP